ncbi:orexin receptor type 2-like [Lingula anatina]|uniref:Orexin receptor type 2-like n=1 Tax=Lingula anatina TaxID=7574 RepID=A0A2R2MRP8_LINAN|nr:orexin receptor type 2-like [Lingula anatina]|eukprot:XP_023932926.1 orexin receptor type 2-like [Lingula anatina]
MSSMKITTLLYMCFSGLSAGVLGNPLANSSQNSGYIRFKSVKEGTYTVYMTSSVTQITERYGRQRDVSTAIDSNQSKQVTRKLHYKPREVLGPTTIVGSHSGYHTHNQSDVTAGSITNCTMPRSLATGAKHGVVVTRRIARFLIYSLGIVFNLLSIAVFCRGTLRHTTTCNFMISVSIADTVLLLDGFMFLLEYDVDVDVISPNPALCKTALFVFYSAPEYSGLILTVMSAERFVKVRFPIKASTLCTMRKTRGIIIGVSVAVLFINSPVLFTDLLYEYIPECKTTICWNFLVYEARPVGSHGILSYYAYIHKWLSSTLYWIIPLTSLPVINFLIIHETSKATERIRSQSEPAEGKVTGQHSTANHKTPTLDSRERSQRQVTRMLLVVTFAYVILVTPINLLNTGVINLWDTTQNVARQWVFTVSVLLFYINHSINFWLYCFSAPKYRHEFFEMVYFAKRRCATLWTRLPKISTRTREGISRSMDSVDSVSHSTSSSDAHATHIELSSRSQSVLARDVELSRSRDATSMTSSGLGTLGNKLRQVPSALRNVALRRERSRSVIAQNDMSTHIVSNMSSTSLESMGVQPSSQNDHDSQVTSVFCPDFNGNGQRERKLDVVDVGDFKNSDMVSSVSSHSMVNEVEANVHQEQSRRSYVTFSVSDDYDTMETEV